MPMDLKTYLAPAIEAIEESLVLSSDLLETSSTLETPGLIEDELEWL